MEPKITPQEEEQAKASLEHLKPIQYLSHIIKNLIATEKSFKQEKNQLARFNYYFDYTSYLQLSFITSHSIIEESSSSSKQKYNDLTSVPFRALIRSLRNEFSHQLPEVPTFMRRNIFCQETRVAKKLHGFAFSKEYINYLIDQVYRTRLSSCLKSQNKSVEDCIQSAKEVSHQVKLHVRSKLDHKRYYLTPIILNHYLAIVLAIYNPAQFRKDEILQKYSNYLDYYGGTNLYERLSLINHTIIDVNYYLKEQYPDNYFELSLTAKVANFYTKDH